MPARADYNWRESDINDPAGRAGPPRPCHRNRPRPATATGPAFRSRGPQVGTRRPASILAGFQEGAAAAIVGNLMRGE